MGIRSEDPEAHDCPADRPREGGVDCGLHPTFDYPGLVPALKVGTFGAFGAAFLRGMRNLTELSRSLLRALGIINSLRMNDENRIKLYEAARSFIGTDASPNDLAPDELGCAETVNEIIRRASWRLPAQRQPSLDLLAV